MSTSLPPPKRNLSAYNLFFQCERKRILQGTSGNGVPLSFEEVSRVTLEYKLRGKRRHKKTHGKVAFRDMARMIAKSWRVLDDESKMALNAQAAIEKAEYQKQVAAWKAAEAGMDDHAPNNDTNVLQQQEEEDQEEQEGGSTRNTLQENNGQTQNETSGPRRNHQEDQIQHHGGSFSYCFSQVTPSPAGRTTAGAAAAHGGHHRFNTCCSPHSFSCHHDEQREGETRGFSGTPHGGSEEPMAMIMNGEAPPLLLEQEGEHGVLLGSFELLCSPSSVLRRPSVTTMHPNGGCFEQNWRTNAIAAVHHSPPPTAQEAPPPKNKNASCRPPSALKRVTMDWDGPAVVNEQDGNDHSMMLSSNSCCSSPKEFTPPSSFNNLFIHLLGTNYDLLHQIIAPDELDALFDDGEDDL